MYFLAVWPNAHTFRWLGGVALSILLRSERVWAQCGLPSRTHIYTHTFLYVCLCDIFFNLAILIWVAVSWFALINNSFVWNVVGFHFVCFSNSIAQSLLPTTSIYVPSSLLLLCHSFLFLIDLKLFIHTYLCKYYSMHISMDTKII